MNSTRLFIGCSVFLMIFINLIVKDPRLRRKNNDTNSNNLLEITRKID